jgi:hypothetical protein
MIEGIAYVAAFVCGMGLGGVILEHGYKLGFKASYEIRRGLTGEDTDQGLLDPAKDPAEFALVDEEEKDTS